MKRLFLMLLIGIVFVVVACKDKDHLDKTEEFDFTVSGIISPVKYKRSEKAYLIDPGKEALEVMATWSPSGARVIFGFIDAKTDEELWESPQESGSWQGTIKTSNLKTGEYYIAVKTEPEINDYDKSERSIVAHFNWK